MGNPSPKYRVQLFAYADTTTYGVGSLIAEFDNAKNIGYGKYLNGVPEAFFTIDQGDAKASSVRGYEGKCHVRIYRNTDLVWTGWGVMEKDASERDVVFYCYGYLAGLFWSLTGWNQQWTSATTKTIVDDLWTRAKTTITQSMLGFVTTGTTEALVTTSGGSTAITLPTYSTFYKRILFVYKELAALGISDTTNACVFEITHSTTPTFNFWKNRGTDQSNVEWRYGGGLVAGFKCYEAQVFRRNDVLAVGSAPNNQLLRYETVNSSDQTAYGTRQEPVYMTWVRDQTELQRGVNWRAARGLVLDPDITLRFFPNAVIPPDATGAGFKLSDRVKVVIDRGATSINGYYMTTGVQVLWVGGVEHVKVMVEERSGS